VSGPAGLTQNLVDCERALRRYVPCRWPVDIHIKRGLAENDSALGCTVPVLDARSRKYRLVIELEWSLTEQEAINTLMHEWAHAATWQFPGDHHGPRWGKSFARCYRVAMEGQRPKSRRGSRR